MIVCYERGERFVEEGNPIGESPIPCVWVKFEKSSLAKHREILSEGDTGTVDESTERNEK